MNAKRKLLLSVVFLTASLWVVLPPGGQQVAAAGCCADCAIVLAYCNGVCDSTYQENSPEWFACRDACQFQEECCVQGSAFPGCHGVPCSWGAC